MTKYGLQKTVKEKFSVIVEKTKAELAKEGFGILTEINVRETLKKKLDVDYQNYIILGACHPQSTYQMLQKEQEIGLLLPCNVIVYKKNEGEVTVSAIRPTSAMQIVENGAALSLAEEVEKKLKRVLDNIIK